MAQAKTQQLELRQPTHDVHRKYAYVLAVPNQPRGGVYDASNNRLRSEQTFKPYLNVLLSSSIWWPGGQDPYIDKNRPAGRYSICYYDGCTTLFVDDQPRDIDTLKSLKSTTRRVDFIHGFCFVDGMDVLLKNYLDWASYNQDSPYRVTSVEVKWKNVDTEKDLLSEGELMDMEDRVMQLAKTAPVKKMKTHGRYLGIAMVDPVTNQPFSDSTIRIEYRKMAKSNPQYFEKSYNDKTVEMRTWITDAINNGQLSLSLIPGRVCWPKGTEILDVSGIKNTEIIIDNLVEFSQTDSGSDFQSQMKSLNT